MISPRAYLQSRAGVINEKSPVSSGKRRSSKTATPRASSPGPQKGSLSRPKPEVVQRRPSPIPVPSPPSRSDGSAATSDDADDTCLLERQSSQPVTIPVKKSATTNQVPKSVPAKRTRRKVNEARDGLEVPPAVAALLATTTIPPSKARPGRLMKANSSLTRRISREHLRNEFKKDIGPGSLGSGSPLDFLLSSSDTEDNDNSMNTDLVDSDDRSFTATSRSMSSESMLSTPSLDYDVGTYSSMHSSLATPTPSMRRGSRSDRKVCSPPALQCDDHPLLATAISEESLTSPTPVSQSPPNTGTSFKSRFKFTSNLTLSFQALRSAAKSFSNFTAPSIPSDDFITRSLFASQKYASEMRPRSFDSVPDPAVRRYFNPMPALSSPDFHSMLTDALGATGPDLALANSADAATPMIPMQTYSRSNRKQRRPSVERNEANLPARTITRQREPRENSDFLRVIVLEMNMRRVGKLDAKTGGRARIWLPPRQSFASAAPPSKDIQRVIPSRWVPQTVEEE